MARIESIRDSDGVIIFYKISLNQRALRFWYSQYSKNPRFSSYLMKQFGTQNVWHRLVRKYKHTNFFHESSTKPNAGSKKIKIKEKLEGVAAKNICC